MVILLKELRMGYYSRKRRRIDFIRMVLLMSPLTNNQYYMYLDRLDRVSAHPPVISSRMRYLMEKDPGLLTKVRRLINDHERERLTKINNNRLMESNKIKIPRTELRIGNTVRDFSTKGHRTVTAGMLSNWYKLHEPPYEGYEPIEISENDLLARGFKKLDDRCFKFPNSGWDLFKRFDRSGVFFWSIDNGECDLDLYIGYLHQLQNIYFALTEKELVVTINENNSTID